MEAESVNFSMMDMRSHPGNRNFHGLPATYTEAEEEAQTLRVFLKDSLTGAQLELLYTIFEQYSAIARSARLKNSGNQNLHILNMMSLKSGSSRQGLCMDAVIRCMVKRALCEKQSFRTGNYSNRQYAWKFLS